LQQQPSSTWGDWGVGPGAGRQQQIMGWQNSGPWPQPSGQSDAAPQPQSQPAGGMGAVPQPQPGWGPGPRQAPAANSSADMA